MRFLQQSTSTEDLTWCGFNFFTSLGLTSTRTFFVSGSKSKTSFSRTVSLFWPLVSPKVLLYAACRSCNVIFVWWRTFCLGFLFKFSPQLSFFCPSPQPRQSSFLQPSSFLWSLSWCCVSSSASSHRPRSQIHLLFEISSSLARPSPRRSHRRLTKTSSSFSWFSTGSRKKVGVFVHIYPTLQNILKS